MNQYKLYIYKLIRVIHNDNRKKNKYMTLSTDAEKEINEIQNTFMTKALNKLGTEGAYLKIHRLMHTHH